MTARIKCGLVEIMECGELPYGMRFPLKCEVAICKSYVRPAILYGSEAWCLKKSDKRVLQRIERFMVREMCEVQLKDKKMMLIVV